MKSSLVSYGEAWEQVRRFIQACEEGREISVGSGEVGDYPIGSQAGGGFSSRRDDEWVSLYEAAGRVLAEGIRADRDQPPFARSTRDGYACRAGEAATHEFLFVAGQVKAGQGLARSEAMAGADSAAGSEPGSQQVGGTAPGSDLPAAALGQAWEIMTGAPVPGGADAVFMVEHAEHSARGAGTGWGNEGFAAGDFVRLLAGRQLAIGENIVPRGAEAKAGDLLLPAGMRLGAAQIALAAQCGSSRLKVVKRPRVAILSTGDELVAIDEVPGPSQIRNSNSPMLAALVRESGGEPVVLTPVPDQAAELDRAVGMAMAADLLLVTGGISAGRFDLVEGALTRAGARYFFAGAAIQPGKPVVFGQLPRLGDRSMPFFGLPGNPISSAVTYRLFAAPLVQALAGELQPAPRFMLARLGEGWRGKGGLTRFFPGRVEGDGQVRVVPWQGSGDLAAFSRSNCLVRFDPEVEEAGAGSLVAVLLF